MKDSTGSFDILEWRRTAQSFGQGCLQALGTGRPHPKVRAAALLRQAETAPPDMITDMQTCLGTYGQAVLDVEQCMAKIGSTLASDARDQTTQLLRLADMADTQLKALASAVETFGQWKASQKLDREKKQRKSSIKIGQVSKLLHSQGTPLSLAKYMVSAGWVPCGSVGATLPEFVPTSVATVIDGESGEQALLAKGVWDSPIYFSLAGSVSGT